MDEKDIGKSLIWLLTFLPSLYEALRWITLKKVRINNRGW